MKTPSLLLALLNVAFSSAKPLPFSDPGDKGGWKLVESVSDEFNGASLDLSKWINLGQDGEIDVFEHFGENSDNPNSAYRYHTSFHDWRKGSPTFGKRIWENDKWVAINEQRNPESIVDYCCFWQRRNPVIVDHLELIQSSR